MEHDVYEWLAADVGVEAVVAGARDVADCATVADAASRAVDRAADRVERHCRLRCSREMTSAAACVKAHEIQESSLMTRALKTCDYAMSLHPQPRFETQKLNHCTQRARNSLDETTQWQCQHSSGL